jgi:hypothetical protein
MPPRHQLHLEIGRLTHSIENATTADRFKTEVLQLTPKDLRKLKKLDWLFDWKKEVKDNEKSVYKLVICNNPDIIQGLISIQDKGDHIFMHLIESSSFNRGKRKVYLGVPGNLVAFACTKARQDSLIITNKPLELTCFSQISWPWIPTHPVNLWTGISHKTRNFKPC